MAAEIFDIKTGERRDTTSCQKRRKHKTRKHTNGGCILTRKEERIVEALEELREGGGLGALGRLVSCLYDWIYDKKFVDGGPDSKRRGIRSDALLGCCLNELDEFYDEETSPGAVAKLLRKLARHHREFWRPKKRR